VVALKPEPNGRPEDRDDGEKQERRGGIETESIGGCGSCPRVKQERRGGIETRVRSISGFPGRKEAGTPWWH